MRQASAKSRKNGGRTLVSEVREKLFAQIHSGRYKPGDRLPSEARLTEEFEVSRTVIREAVASLRADGIVEPRQGAGIFVLEPPATPPLPFQTVDPARVSSMIEMLELRIGIEVEAAGFAALRRSPSQEEAILTAFHALRQRAADGGPTPEADLALHLAIADATNNPRFREFLTLIGTNLIPRHAIGTAGNETGMTDYLDILNREHETIVNAILDGDDAAAREAMRAHLRGSLARYRKLLHQQNAEPA